MPTSSNKAMYTTPDECIFDIAGAEAKNVDLGGGPLKIVNGGSLTVYDWFIIGYGAEDVEENAGYLEVRDGGVLKCMQRLFVGRGLLRGQPCRSGVRSYLQLCHGRLGSSCECRPRHCDLAAG